MAEDTAPIWADRSFLQNVQYRDDGNLAARQSIYAYQEPTIDLPAAVIDALQMTGAEIVADVGCGNGLYLAELARRGHRGPVLGVDMSPGMLDAARTRAAGLRAARLLAADATALPLRDGVSDLTLAMHMLYHLPEPAEAVSELRRVTRLGGQVVLGLNGGDHLRELRDIMSAVLADTGRIAANVVRERITLDRGEELAAGFFGSVIRRDFAGELLLPDPRPVAGYVRSMSITQHLADQDRIVDAVSSRMDFGSDGLFRVRTHAGCLICT